MGWADEVGGGGMPARKPRVLLVDHDHRYLDLTARWFAENSDFEIVKMPIGSAAAEGDGLSATNPACVIKYALNSCNGIDAVLTDWKKHDHDKAERQSWDDAIISQLKGAAQPFRGIVAVHSATMWEADAEYVRNLGADAALEKGNIFALRALAEQIRNHTQNRDRGLTPA